MDLLKKKMEIFVFDCTVENKDVLAKHTEFWDGIKNEVETINGGKASEYGTDFTKININ